MVEKLAPLHHHGGELAGRDVAVAVNQSADRPSAGQRLAVDGQADAFDAVGILGREEALERPERCAPFRMIGIVATAVPGAVQLAERRALDRVGSQRTVAIEIRLTEGDAALVAEPIPLADGQPFKKQSRT